MVALAHRGSHSPSGVRTFRPRTLGSNFIVDVFACVLERDAFARSPSQLISDPCRSRRWEKSINDIGVSSQTWEFEEPVEELKGRWRGVQGLDPDVWNSAPSPFKKSPPDPRHKALVAQVSPNLHDRQVLPLPPQATLARTAAGILALLPLLLFNSAIGAAGIMHRRPTADMRKRRRSKDQPLEATYHRRALEKGRERERTNIQPRTGVCKVMMRQHRMH